MASKKLANLDEKEEIITTAIFCENCNDYKPLDACMTCAECSCQHKNETTPMHADFKFIQTKNNGQYTYTFIKE